MRHALAILVICALSVGPVQATTAKIEKTTTVKVKKKHGSKAPKFIKDASETTSERDRRLLRECKGRVNAGACAGYTG